jgi:transglutaminase-like putative cysteine protease
MKAIKVKSYDRLIEILNRIRDEYRPDDPRWGVPGHAAEFLVSQRGFHA